ncbi:TPA: hypothetical protein EYO12_00450 [Candidatus Saccharibacteria bacterium]|nr:hypothetical protein [Candidatus Saccharibacteria bacterium]HIO87565.1 hypothetical protein [Candidatus Saccharibacteria bacterium]
MKKVLILEDNRQFVSLLTGYLEELATNQSTHIQIDVYESERDVLEIVNPNATNWDAILLDYYAVDGTFFKLDFDLIDAHKVIAMSSEPSKNAIARRYGVTHTVQKDYRKLGTSAYAIVQILKGVLFGKEE